MLKRITVVLAQWCPHCVPLALEKAQQMAQALRVELRILDIDDPEQVKIADALVTEYGDSSEDYLIPQVFFEDASGRVQHVLTGFSEGVNITKARWEDLASSEFYGRELRARS